MVHFNRLPSRPSRESIQTHEHAAYDDVADRTARIHGLESPAAQYFGALLNSPPLAGALSRLGTAVRRGGVRGTYCDAERELLDVSLARLLGQNAILPIHIPDALAVGVRPEAIEALLDNRDAELTDDEREIVAFAHAVEDCSVTDAGYARMVARYGVRGAVELTVLIGFLLMTIRLWHAFGVSEPTDAEMRELLRGLREGRIPLPARDARIG